MSWSVGAGVDTDVTVDYGVCPEWDCDEIETSYPSASPCGTIFDTKTGVNEWVGWNENQQDWIYFYFYPEFFEYVCDNTYECLPATFPGISNEGWVDMPVSGYVMMEFGFDRTINCISLCALYT